MPQPVLKKIEIIVHAPTGRRWLRIGGKIVLEETSKNSLTVTEAAKMFYRKAGRTVARLAEELVAIEPLVVTHPQFVRPYEER